MCQARLSKAFTDLVTTMYFPSSAPVVKKQLKLWGVVARHEVRGEVIAGATTPWQVTICL